MFNKFFNKFKPVAPKPTPQFVARLLSEAFRKARLHEYHQPDVCIVVISNELGKKAIAWGFRGEIVSDVVEIDDENLINATLKYLETGTPDDFKKDLDLHS